MKLRHIISIIFISTLFINSVLTINVKSCKNIVACGDATAGNYNLLLKVRDPSRPGLQALCIVPENYRYTYQHPWNGKKMDFIVKNKFIGVTTKGDTVPSVIKPGMAFSTSGIAYGDADTMSNWKNPTRHAWDDFDWIRYACQEADDEDEAVSLMTKDLVDKLHASAVSENLFVVGPKKAFVIEADAFHYDIKEIDDILVMSNYPKELWRTQVHNRLSIARSFDTAKEKFVRRGRVVRLDSLFGVKIVDVGDDSIVARQVPFLKISNKMIRIMGKRVDIGLGERETVGDYSVELLEIDDKRAKVSISYVFKAWEDAMMEYIQSKHGSITVKDMINWSRLHSEDLDGLRPMCEERFQYESAIIYKIPEENYDVLSSGWFAPNHACSSIYVPVHIVDTDIYDPYKNGEAAELSLDLLETYGHGTLTFYFDKLEDIFLYETDDIEHIAEDMIQNNSDVSDFLTIVDTSMQEQAWLTEQIWIEVSKIQDQKDKQDIVEIIGDLWEKNYSVSLEMMENAIDSLRNIPGSEDVIDKIMDIAFNICESRIEAARSIRKYVSTAHDEYTTGKNLIEKNEYSSGFDHIQQAFRYSDILIKGQVLPVISSIKTEKSENEDILLYIYYVLIVISLITICVVLIKKRKTMGFS